ncbi:MAG: IS66 family insertion sequence element accessory protein TnpA, partial [Draconibacterium sp.]
MKIPNLQAAPPIFRMRKNQRNRKDEMYLAVEKWRESGLSQRKFCKREKLALQTFGYWFRKYRNEKHRPTKSCETFIPVEVPGVSIYEPSSLGGSTIEV